MDKDTAKAIDDVLEEFTVYCQDQTTKDFLADRFIAKGLRLDPYPNGKSKDELIAQIEALGAKRDRAWNLLRNEHANGVKEIFAITMERHRELKPDCDVCRFLAETSGVTG